MLISFLAGLTLAGHLSWDMIAALGTVGAVGVALFLPWCERQHRLKAIQLLVEDELSKNKEIWEKAEAIIKSTEKMTLNGRPVEGQFIERWQIAAAMVISMSFDHWEYHWAEYSLLMPSQYLIAKKEISRFKEVKEHASKSNTDPGSRVAFQLFFEDEK